MTYQPSAKLYNSTFDHMLALARQKGELLGIIQLALIDLERGASENAVAILTEALVEAKLANEKNAQFLRAALGGKSNV